MKNSRKENIVQLLFVVSGLLLVAGCSLSSGKPKWVKVGRYENIQYGFSVEYDAEKLDQGAPSAGDFVFMKRSSEGSRMLSVYTGAYPLRMPLNRTDQLIAGSLPMLMPGSQVHGTHNQKTIKLPDQTEAFYFEMKWQMSGLEMCNAVVVVKKDKRMIIVSVSDDAKNPVEASAEIVKTLRFDVKVDLDALKKVGFGNDGLFSRTDSPAFTLRYPKNFRNLPLQGDQIFRAGIPQGSPSIGINIVPLNADAEIDEQLKAGAESYAVLLGAVGTDIRIISNELIADYKGFPACQFEIVWKYRGQTLLTTLGHGIVKENKAILLVGHSVYDTSELLAIFKTIDLNP